MKIFRKKLKREHLIKFDKDLAKMLENEFPLYQETLTLSKFDGYGFTKNPSSIAVGRSFDSELHKKIKDRFTKNFDLDGISIWNKKTKKYKPIKLRFHFDSLSQIFVKEPSNFRDDFNLKKILIEKLIITEIKNIA